MKASPTIAFDRTDAGAMLSSARTLMSRSSTLTMAWRLTNDRTYLDRLVSDINSATALADWYPDHFLVTAEMTQAVSVAYDWGFDAWTEQQRNAMRTAIVEKGLTPALRVYASTTTASPFKFLGNWSLRTDNINVVVNSAMLIGASAVAKDTSSSVVDAIFSKATTSLRIGMRAYSSDGSFAEGPTYWEYATRFLSSAITTLRSSTGSDYGLSGESGFSQTGTFIRALMGPAGAVYGFADSSQDIQLGGALSGLGAALRDSSLVALAATSDSTGFAPQQLLWRDPAMLDGIAAPPAPLDAQLDGSVVTSRGGLQPESSFFSFKYSGTPSASHQHYDVGDFQFQALGQEWAMDLGLEPASYSLSEGSAAPRWQYYRVAPEGHNTLSTHPATTQPPSGTVGSLVKSWSSTGTSATIADLANSNTALYAWRRGIQLFDGRTQLLVQDEISASAPTDVLWSMHTAANIAIAEDGRSAVLYLGGQRLIARLLPASVGVFTSTPAAAYPTSYQPAQESNDGVRKLAVAATVQGSATIAVQLSPLPMGSSATDVPPLLRSTALSTWEAPTTAACKLDSISVGGVPVAGFDPAVAAYSIPQPTGAAPPAVSARATHGSVSIAQGTSTNLSATVTVFDASCSTTTYRVTFPRTELTISSATATATASGSPTFTFDGKPTSSWVAPPVGSTITWKLSEPATPASLVVQWGTIPATDSYTFEWSTDGRTWQAVDAELVKSSSNVQVFTVDGITNAGYLRLATTGAIETKELDVFARVPSDDWYSFPATSLTGVSLSGVPSKMELGSGATAAVTFDASGDIPSDVSVRFVTRGTGALAVTESGQVRANRVGDDVVGVIASWGGVTVSTQVSVTVVDSTRVRIYATADGWAQSSTPTVGYGSQGGSTIKAPWLGSPDRVAYATFDLSQLAGKTVTSAVMSAEMVITETRDGQNVSRVDAHTTTGTFTEAGLTYQNRPTLTDTVGSFVVDRTKKIVTSDLTAAITAAATGSPGAYTLGFTQDDAGASAIAVTLTTREGGTAPYIDITLAPAPAATVPSPVLKSIAVTGIDQVEKGSTATATTSLTDSLGRAFTGATVTYTSQNTGIATVTSAGKVTGVSTGTTRITATATAGQITVSTQVSVTVVDSTRVRIYATADGWAQSSTPTVGYGSQGGSTIKAPWLGSPDRVAYATFDLSQLAGKTVTSAVMSAEMVITETRDGQNVSRVDAHTTTGTFTEAGLTYQNRPTLTDTVGSFVVDRTKKIVTSDLTAAITAAATGSPGAYTLGFTQDDAGASAIAVTLTTREGGTAPYIDITLASAHSE
ncbi:DNRLRE domain-containing protein [Microbacterium mcarthurae (nom. nud.)]|uniref:DNRLRE domain-containing protein n=1 Tax=Microbacterium mcarthurae TaxID=3035918 RepID=A0ABW9GLZ2_9MICO